LRTDVLGVGFDDIDINEAVGAALDIIASNGRGYIVTPNPEIVWLARKDESFRNVLEGAKLVLPDGIGIIYAARILGTPLRARVPGIDFASALLRELALRGGKLFLFGAKPGVAEEAAEKIEAEYKGINICGVNDGYFEDDTAIRAKIAAAEPDVLFVCLGAPKQEKWMAETIASLPAKIMIGLGGALDVYSGRTKRAPKFWRKLGLEWLYRLLKEPKRIGRMLKLPLFLFSAAGERLRGGKGRKEK